MKCYGLLIDYINFSKILSDSFLKLDISPFLRFSVTVRILDLGSPLVILIINWELPPSHFS